MDDYMKANAANYRSYMDRNPDFKDHVENYFEDHPDRKGEYETFLKDNAEFYDSEARYYVQYNPEVVNEHPEFYVMPAVSAYFEVDADKLPEAIKEYMDGNSFRSEEH